MQVKEENKKRRKEGKKERERKKMMVHLRESVMLGVGKEIGAQN